MTRARRTFGAGVALAAWVALAAVAAAGKIHQVPGDFSTIGAALRAAGTGDLILVGPGTYRENLIWPRTDGIRVIATQGPVLTTLDAGYRGRAVHFGPGLTRATVLQGFTIAGGFDKEGAGLYVGSSPTIVRNRILNGLGADVDRNRGAGIYVAPWASPRIERNIIQANVLRGGRTAEGGGIFVGDGASPEILFNTVLGNRAEASDRARGGGIALGVTGIPAPYVFGNVVAQNVTRAVREALGGGIDVAGGTTFLVNNTVADNVCQAIHRARGGGVAYAGSGTFGSRFHNNIVATNHVLAVSRLGGGIHCATTPPVIDFNDVWKNDGGDYFGCLPGLNDRNVDPRFLRAGDYHLAPASPLVDAGADTAVLPVSDRDVDGDVRILDGNWDGLRGNGARVDIGADEHASVRLDLPDPPRLGRRITFRVQGPAAAYYLLFGSLRADRIRLDPFGLVLIGFPAGLVSAGLTPAQVPVNLPGVNALAGLTVYLQALVFQDIAGQRVGQMTDRLAVILFTGPSGVIVEPFGDRRQMEPSLTTAAWTLRGAAGLHATPGYAGNAADGDLLVAGQVVLDSSTRPPGSNGVVAWNFGRLTIARTGRLVLKGAFPIRLNVFDDCLVDGTLDASGRNGRNAPPGKAVNVGRLKGGAGGPGAGAGGDSNTKPTHPIGALPMELRGGPGYPRAARCGDPNKSDNRVITVVEPNCGGGAGGNRGVPSGLLMRDGCSGNGGGHGADGMQTDYLCANIGAFGREYGLKWILPTGPSRVTWITAGAGGGAGGNAAIVLGNPRPRDDIVAGSGGGGGGGVEIVAGRKLHVRPYGHILATGGNGGVGHATVVGGTTIRGGYGAGGAGGSIWLSGASVTVDRSTVVDARGGKGNPAPPSPNRTGNGGDGYVIIRDLSGKPSIDPGAAVTPPAIAGRALFAPSGAGKSAAYSKWYAAAATRDLRWRFDASDPKTGQVKAGRDITFQVVPSVGHQVFVAWQGAPDVRGQPDPDPTHWWPPGNTKQNPFQVYENDIAKLAARRNLRHIRFRIRFDLGPKPVPPVKRPVISRIQVHY